MERKIIDRWTKKDEMGNPEPVLDEGGNVVSGAVNITDSDRFKMEMDDFMDYENEVEFEKINFGEGYPAVRDEMVMEMLYSTGMRRSELINLTPNDLDFFNDQVKVLGKGNKERLIPFARPLANRLKNYLEI